jgi:hypothetical protein
MVNDEAELAVDPRLARAGIKSIDGLTTDLGVLRWREPPALACFQTTTSATTSQQFRRHVLFVLYTLV